MEPIKELPEGIQEWKAFRRILDIITESATDEIMDLVEFLNRERGIIEEGDDDTFYERYEEPVENLIWDAIIESLTPSE